MFTLINVIYQMDFCNLYRESPHVPHPDVYLMGIVKCGVFRSGSIQNYIASNGHTMNASVYQWYWASWSAGTVALGRGTLINLNIILLFTDSTTTTTGQITNLGYSSRPPSANSYWIFNGCYPYYPPGDWLIGW